MANSIEQIIGGFIGGLVAGLTGYVIDLVIGTMFEAFQPFNPLFAVYGVVFAIVSFLSGIMEAYYVGFFFSFGIISVGFLLNDFVTIVSGFISIGGIVISLFFKYR